MGPTKTPEDSLVAHFKDAPGISQVSLYIINVLQRLSHYRLLTCLNYTVSQISQCQS